MKKKTISAIILSTAVFSAVIPTSNICAETNTDISKQDTTISNAQSAKVHAQAQVDSLQSKVDNLEQKQISTKNQISKIKSEARTLNTQIVSINESIHERAKLLDAQARSVQVNSSATSYMDTIVSSKSLTDAIQKVSAIATISSANKQMLDQQEQEQKELNQKSETVKKNYNQFVSLSQNLDSQAQELTSQQAKLKVATLNYQATITTAEAKKQALLDEKAAAQQAAEEASQKQAAYEAQQKQAEKAATNKTIVPSSSTDSSSSDSYPDGGTKGGGAAGENPYAGGGCTDFVWQYFAAKGIYIANISPGNGGQWATNGPAQGILHVVSAAPGVIVSGYSEAFVGYANSPYGHVAIVTAVNSDGTINVIEGGYGSGWWGHTRSHISSAGLTFLLPN